MPNRWTTFVREYANQHDMTYPCAMSDADCKAQYKEKYGNRKKLSKKQEKELMGMEDVNVAKKPRKKKNIILVEDVEEVGAPKKRGRKQKYATDEERKEVKRIQTQASNKKRYAEKKAEKKGSGITDTYRNKFNKKYGFDKNESHSIEEIAKISGYAIDGLKTIYDKGIGAYKTNPSSVRPQVKSAEQWGMGRVYSAIMGGKAMNVDKSHLIKGDGILQDIAKGAKKVGKKVNQGLQTAVDYTENTANKVIEGTKDVAEDVAKYGKTVVYGRMDYPPKVRGILKTYGEEIVTSYKIKRSPVSSLLTSALSAVSLGKFGKRFGRSEYDDLFHLFLEMTTSSGKKISVEKNEVINMDISPPTRPKEEVKDITSNIPDGLTINELMSKTEERMGKKEFYGYSARDNNCQDFIVSILKANNIGDETDQKFVKQDTKSLFDNLTFLRKFSNTLTTIGARANVATTGAGFNENIIFSTNSIKKMPHKQALLHESTHSCPYCETSMTGGKINIGKAFTNITGREFKSPQELRDDFGITAISKGGKKAGNKIADYTTSKKGGLASDLIKYGIPAASGATLGGLATLATGGNPVAGVAATALGSKLGAMGASKLQKATGTGMRKARFAKGSQEAKDYMASIRKKKK